MYIADGDYIKDIEVNDLRNRYTLTKGATQKMVKLILSSGIRLSLQKLSPPMSLIAAKLFVHLCGIQLLLSSRIIFGD
jgi:hypothetical protein